MNSTSRTTAPAAPDSGHPDEVLAIRDLRMSYGDVHAVRGVDVSVRRGEILGVVGHNGAGKTTTVECAQGLRTPTSGSIEILGVDVIRQRTRLGSRVGSQLQDAALPDRLRVGEAMRLFADEPVTRADVAIWGLDDLWSRPFGALSGGQQQRLFIALALVNRPELVFLDELTQGLDPLARQDIWQLIDNVRSLGTTVVLVTHFADEAEKLCDRLVVMAEGNVVAEGTPRSLTDSYGPGVRVRYTDPSADAEALRQVPGVSDVVLSGSQVLVRGTRTTVPHLGAHLIAAGSPPDDFNVTEPTLDEALLSIMAGAPGPTSTRP